MALVHRLQLHIVWRGFWVDDDALGFVVDYLDAKEALADKALDEREHKVVLACICEWCCYVLIPKELCPSSATKA
jgi:hypothetical protein